MTPSQPLSLFPSFGPRAQRDGCPVCGGHEVARDEVSHAGPLQLAECARCLHRWTWRAAASSIRPAPVPAVQPYDEVASAA